MVFGICRKKILVTHEDSNIEITGELLRCLRPGAWLNDEVILKFPCDIWEQRNLLSDIVNTDFFVL